MGTRNNPGRFDCHDKAEPDEPTFTLLGRDPVASVLVVLWADVREWMGETEPAAIEDARECAKSLAAWTDNHGKQKKRERVIKILLEEYTTRATEVTEKTALMIKGLVRFAELREQDEPSGKIWDDKSREALELARECGWGKDRTGRLP